jgi:uncharacterized membrane protein
MKDDLSTRKKLWFGILFVLIGLVLRVTLSQWASTATPEKAIAYGQLKWGSLLMIAGGLMMLVGMALTALGNKLKAMGEKLEAEKKGKN